MARNLDPVNYSSRARQEIATHFTIAHEHAKAVIEELEAVRKAVLEDVGTEGITCNPFVHELSALEELSGSFEYLAQSWNPTLNASKLAEVEQKEDKP